MEAIVGARVVIILAVFSQIVVMTRYVKTGSSPVPPPSYAATVDTGHVTLSSGEAKDSVTLSFPLSKSLVFWNCYTNVTNPDRAAVGMGLVAIDANTTKIYWVRDSSTDSVRIFYTVLTMTDGLTTYQLKATGDGTTDYTLNIGATVDTTRTSVFVSGLFNTYGTSYQGDMIVGSKKLFPSTSQIQLDFGLAPATTDTMYVQVAVWDSIEWTRSYDWTLMTSGTLTATVTTASADSLDAWLVPLYSGNSSNDDTTGAYKVTFEKTSDTEVSAKRNIGNSLPIVNSCLQQGKFLDNSSLAIYRTAFSTSDLTKTVVHSEVEWDRTFCWAPSNWGGMMRDAYKNRWWGVGMATMVPLTVSTTELRRSVSISTAANHVLQLIQIKKVQE